MRKPIGTGCAYCGTVHLKGKTPTAKVGNYSLPVSAEVGAKITKIQKAAKIAYMLKVCPACGTIIGVIEETG